MKRLLFVAGMVIAILTLTIFPNSTLADENIYSLRIENINRDGADFYWSTAIETNGSITYSYTKLPELYNPQAPGSSQEVLITATPALTESEDGYLKDHHIKIDNLDIDYCPFVQYKITSETSDGEVYTISGEFVLVDTGKINWWQDWWYVVVIVPIITFIVGQIAWPTITIKVWKRIKRNKTVQK